MSSSGTNPTQTPGRNHRQTKPRSPKPIEQTDTAHAQDTSVNSPTPSRSKRKNRNNNNRTQPKDIPLSSSYPVSPLTPPRASDQLDMLPLDGNISPIVPIQKNNRARAKSNRSRLNNASAPPTGPILLPGFNGQSGTTTPTKPVAQMYAGPTFHASPAASSLPIPKFFSRSAPPTDTESSSKAVLEESSEESSSVDEESPTLRNSTPAENQKIREPSPLDILFKADREEKARLQLTSPPSTESYRPQSSSQAGSSVFPMELEGSPRMLSELQRSESSPPVLLSKETSDAQAKTAALKNFLLLPTPQRPQSGTWSNASTRGSSPASTPGPFTGSRRNISGSSTPVYTPMSSYTSPPYDSFSFTTGTSINKRASQPRPISSQLRQELTDQMLSDLNELPSSPTPARYKLFKQASTPNSGNIFSFPQPASTKFQAEDALRAAAIGLDSSQPISGNIKSTKTLDTDNPRPLSDIEASLRQILNINIKDPVAT